MSFCGLLPACLVLLGAAFTCTSARLIRSPRSPPAPRVLTPPPRHAELPRSFDWRNENGTNFVTAVRNQFLPRWCGSCWAQAVTSSLSDRLKIGSIRASPGGTGGGVVDVDLSPQPLLDCAGGVGTCEGGDDLLAYEWIAQNGISDTTCVPYEASDNNCLHGTSACRICRADGTCSPVPNATKVYVTEHGGFSGRTAEENATEMQQEIYARGPISCSIYDEIDKFHCYASGVLDYPPITKHTTHVISVLGWGEEEPGDPQSGYWIARHSGGRYWGEDGFFRIRRGNNTLRIEEFCYWGVPGITGGRPPKKICTD